MYTSKKIPCHQFATGRGPSGYGFVEYSRGGKEDRNATFQFSLSKGMNLRFSQIPEGSAYVLEVDPASTDYRHMGAFMTKSREEAGSVSLYTHVLMTETPSATEALGLLRESNFLTPEQFAEVTHGTRTLIQEEKDCTLLTGKEQLSKSQLDRLGEFLARYWFLLEQKEWSGKVRPEVALLLPQKTEEERIRFFACEVVSRLPEYVRPAVSVSFGAQWDNRGSIPCVCTVVTDNRANPYPCYHMGPEGTNYARSVGEVESRIGQILVKGDPELYPQVYRNIEECAKTDERFSAMARCYSTMAYSVQAILAEEKSQTVDPVPELQKIYQSITLLAEKRFGIKLHEIRKALMPLSMEIFTRISRKKEKKPEDIANILNENIALHQSGLTQTELNEIDHFTLEMLESLPNPRSKITYFWNLYQKRDDGTANTQKDLQPLITGLVRNIGNLGEHIQISDVQILAQLRFRLGKAGLEKSENSQAVAEQLIRHMLLWQNAGDFSAGTADPETESYNTAHFGELVKNWLDGSRGAVTENQFHQIKWEISSLSDTLKKVDRKLAQGPYQEAAKRFDLLETAENKLLELHQKDGGKLQTVESAEQQFARLSGTDSEKAKKLAEKYRIFLCKKENREVLYQSLNKSGSILGNETDLLLELLKSLKTDMNPNEQEISGFMQAAESIRKKNPEGASALLTESYEKIVSQAAQAGPLSETSLRRITDYVLDQEQNVQTIGYAYDLAIRNVSVKAGGAYLDQLCKKTVNSTAAKDKEFRNIVLSKLEQAAAAGFSSEETDQAVRKLLDLNDNQLPVGNYPYCRRIAGERLQKGLQNFFEKAGTLDPKTLEEKWNHENRKAYSCEWSALKEEQLNTPVRESIQREYETAKDQIGFFASLLDKNQHEPTGNYSRTLNRLLTEKLGQEYDSLWRGAIQNSGYADEARKTLDTLLDRCMEEEPGNRSLSACALTTAGKARAFMRRLRELSRVGMNRRPEEAGELLRLLKRENGFGQCLRLDKDEIEHRKEDDLFDLTMMLMSELSLQSAEGSSYWQQILQDYGFDSSENPWSGEGMRMINILAYLVGKLNRMKASELAADLKGYLGPEYMNRLWNEKINKEWFEGAGDKVLSPALYNWILYQP